MFTAAYVNYLESSRLSSSVSGAGAEQGAGGAAPVPRVGLAWPEPCGGVAQTTHIRRRNWAVLHVQHSRSHH